MMRPFWSNARFQLDDEIVDQKKSGFKNEARKLKVKSKKRQRNEEWERDEQSETESSVFVGVEEEEMINKNDDCDQPLYVHFFNQSFSCPLYENMEASNSEDLEEHVTLTSIFAYVPERQLTICVNFKRREYRNCVTIWSFLKHNHKKKKNFDLFVDEFVTMMDDVKVTRQAPVPTVSGFKCVNFSKHHVFSDRSGDVEFVKRFWKHMKTIFILLARGVSRYPWNASMVALDYDSAVASSKKAVMQEAEDIDDYAERSKRAEKLMLRHSLNGVTLPLKKECVHMTMRNFIDRYEGKRCGHTIRYLVNMSNQSVENLSNKLEDLEYL